MTTTVAAARTLLVKEGYTAEDVDTAIDSLIDAGLETPVADQPGGSTDDLLLEDWEIQILREQIVSERGVSIEEITAALAGAGIDYRVEHPGTLNAVVRVGELFLGPSVLNADGNGLGIDSYADGDGHDWHETVAGAVARATTYAR